MTTAAERERGGTMEAVAGLVTAGILVLGAIVGVRLLRLGARSHGPERWLGLYFLLAPCLGTLLSSAVYVSWSGAELSLPDAWIRRLHAADLLCMSAGLACLYVFTWRTFRPGSHRARGAVGLALGALAFSLVAFGLTEGFAVRVWNGWTYWVGWCARSGALLWMAAESLHYWGLQRRRLRLGLADPVVANRFLLWGVWASTVFLLGASDPLARLWYWATTGTREVWLPELGRPIVLATLVLTAALGVVMAVLMVLTFFPTRSYRRWIASRPGSARASI